MVLLVVAMRIINRCIGTRGVYSHGVMGCEKTQKAKHIMPNKMYSVGVMG